MRIIKIQWSNIAIEKSLLNLISTEQLCRLRMHTLLSNHDNQVTRRIPAKRYVSFGHKKKAQCVNILTPANKNRSWSKTTTKIDLQ